MFVVLRKLLEEMNCHGSNSHNYRPLSSKETVYFLMQKLQEKEKELSLMRNELKSKHAAIVKLEEVISTGIETLVLNQRVKNAVKARSVTTQTRSDLLRWSLECSTRDCQSAIKYGTIGARPHRERSRLNSCARCKILLDKGTQTPDEFPFVADSTAHELHSLTAKLLRSELARVSRDLKALEFKIRESLLSKELELRNAENHTGEHSHNIGLEPPPCNDRLNRLTEQAGTEALDDLNVLQQEVGHKAAEVIFLDQNINELNEIMNLIQCAETKVHRAPLAEDLDEESDILSQFV